jgi:hypothetical protein
MIDNVVLVTTTFYKDPRTELRYKLALETATKAQEAGYYLIVVDGSPDPIVASELRSRGVKVFPQLHQGMGSSRRQVYFHALEVLKLLGSKERRAIVWLEPEKEDLIQYICSIVDPILNGSADVVIPQRTNTSWDSYPVFQKEMEQQGNAEVAQMTGKPDLDLFFGPVASTTDAAQLVIQCDPKKEGFTDTYIPQLLGSMTLKSGFRVISHPVNFIYPSDQKLEEEVQKTGEMIRKRKDQLDTVREAHSIISRRKKS